MIIRFKKGFTMAELMIVIGVIGILAATLYPSYAAYLSRGRDVRRISDIKIIVGAYRAYNIDTSKYRIPSTGWHGGGNGPANYSDSSYWGGSAVSRLQQLGYITNKSIPQFDDITILNNLITSNIGSCNPAPNINKDIYDLQYGTAIDGGPGVQIFGYLENAKPSDLANIAWWWYPQQCLAGGYNYRVGTE